MKHLVPPLLDGNRPTLSAVYPSVKTSSDERIMRIVGFLGVVFGLALIYVGIYVV